MNRSFYAVDVLESRLHLSASSGRAPDQTLRLLTDPAALVSQSTTDSAGNVFVSGAFSGTVDFNPSSRKTHLETADASNVGRYVAKYSPSGGLFWVRVLRNEVADQNVLVTAMTTDSAGNLYAAGSIQGTVDFDPSSREFRLSASPLPKSVYDSFIWKLDSAGNFAGATVINYDRFAVEAPSGIGVDSSGNIFISNTLGRNDQFIQGKTYGAVSRISADLKPVWTVNVGKAYAGGLVLDLEGHPIVVGSNFDSGSVIKLSARGKFLWEIKTEGQARGDQTFGRALIGQLAVDSANNLIMAGTINGAVDFDPTAGQSIPLSPSGEDVTLGTDNDAYIAKYTPAGSLIFAQTIGGDGDEQGKSVAIGSNDSIYLAGTFAGRADFDPAPTRGFFLESPLLAEDGVEDPDLFVARFSSAGKFVSAGSIGYTARGLLTQLQVHAENNSAFLVVGTPGIYPALESIDDHSSHLYRYDF